MSFIDAEGDENSEDEKDDGEEDLDKQMGDLGDEQADRLDEQVWGSDDEDDKEDESKVSEASRSSSVSLPKANLRANLCDVYFTMSVLLLEVASSEPHFRMVASIGAPESTVRVRHLGQGQLPAGRGGRWECLFWLTALFTSHVPILT